MKTWYISSNGNKHEFYRWKDATQMWDIVKAAAPGDAFLCRGCGTVIDCA